MAVGGSNVVSGSNTKGAETAPGFGLELVFSVGVDSCSCTIPED